jgi:transposase
MEKQMKRRGMTIIMIWEQYRAIHPQGYAITHFYKYYRHFTKRAQPVMHIEHKADDKMYIDFTGEKLSITGKDSGEVLDVEVFISIISVKVNCMMFGSYCFTK